MYIEKWGLVGVRPQVSTAKKGEYIALFFMNEVGQYIIVLEIMKINDNLMVSYQGADTAQKG